MEKMTVAILDSGINYKDSFFKPYIKEGKSFIGDDATNYIDENGHGSMCAAAIIKENPCVNLYIGKILDEHNLSNLKILEDSLESLLGQKDVSIISLSLTLVSKRKERKLQEICEELCKQGKIIICTLANGREKSYPAISSHVIGVRGFILESENTYWFNRKRKIQAVTDVNPYLLRNNRESFQLFGKCNSYATAKFTGIVSRIMQERDITIRKELEVVLEESAMRNRWTRWDLKESKRFPCFEANITSDSNLVGKIVEIVSDYLNIEEPSLLYIHNLFDSHIGLNYSTAFYLLKEIEKEFNIHILDYSNISRYDFYSIYALEALVRRYQE